MSYDRMAIWLRRNKVVFTFPTNDGLHAIFVGWSIEQLPTVRADIERHFTAAVDEVPELAERVRSGRREERFAGAIGLPNYLRKPYGPGWALVGDAGCHKDPYLALGVCDGLIPPESFYNPENLQRIMRSASAGPADAA